MKKTQPSFTNSNARTTLLIAEVDTLSMSWLLTCDINQNSPRTMGSRREVMNKFLWFLRIRGIETVGVHEIRQFLHYLGHGHMEPGGRWGNPRQINPVSSGTIKTYHSILRTFFSWCQAEGEIDSSPMLRIPPPTDRPDQVQPLNAQQLNAILGAAKRSLHPRRDEALVLFLLDTGVRATELCDLRRRDVDLQAGSATVMGKGHKTRTVPFSRDTKRALFQYLNSRPNDAEAALFQSDRGVTAGDGLTRHGLRFLVRRLAEAAHVKGVRVSPHTFRHTFAISFLRGGGNVFTLQQILGHTNLAMTNRYVAIAQADVANQHQRCSPVSHLKRGTLA